MADVYVGQIMMCGFGYAPRGFAACNGQLLPVTQNQALFALLGVQYGGDGRTTFALPNLQGTTPVGFGFSADPAWQPVPYVAGARAGVESVTLTAGQLPAHMHMVGAQTSPGNVKVPTGALFSNSGAQSIYASDAGTQVTLASQMLGASGGSQAHPNMQPFRVINFVIALNGIYPQRN